jgi:hypothetical protein
MGAEGGEGCSGVAVPNGESSPRKDCNSNGVKMGNFVLNYSKMGWVFSMSSEIFFK